MICAICDNCRYPRSANDNNGNCKCKIMKHKTIEVSVSEGQVPDWCPLNKGNNEEPESVSNVMCRNIIVKVDISKARLMLEVAGFNDVSKMTAPEVFDKVLSMIEIYGATVVKS